MSRTSLRTSQNAGKLGTSQNPFRFWHGIIFQLPFYQWEVPGTSGSFLVNFPKCWQAGNIPKTPWIMKWHYFQLSWINGQFLELLGTSSGTSQNAGKLGTSQNPFWFWHGIILNFPGSMGSSRNFWELPQELPKMLASWELINSVWKC